MSAPPPPKKVVDIHTLGRTYYVYEIVGGKVVTDGSTATINNIEYTAGQKTAYATLDAITEEHKNLLTIPPKKVVDIHNPG